jgi:amino acid adenylation domain-containing protein
MNGIPSHKPCIDLATRFITTAGRYADRPALRIGGRSYTYKELHAKAQEFSSAVGLLAESEKYVAILARKNMETYAGILGILMAGKAYMPLNPRFPEIRSLYMLQKSGTCTVIADQEAFNELPGLFRAMESKMKVMAYGPHPGPLKNRKQSGHKYFHLGEVTGPGPWQVRVEPGAQAYLLFTSGSTGRPKGVPVSHGNVSAYLDFLLDRFDFSPGNRFSQTFDLTFDLSVHDLFVCWSSGGCLCVPDDNSSFGLARYLREERPACWFSVPSVADLLNRMRLLRPGAYPGIRNSFFCGEALLASTAEAWAAAAPGSRIINLYGPTEATIAVSMYELPQDPRAWKSKHGIISIGKIFEGNHARLGGVDENELFLAGRQVVGGYLDEEMTAASFITDPGTGQCYYHTGDLAAEDADGDLFFLGRADTEVKISGYRVNLAEVEYALEADPSVRRAVAFFPGSSGLSVAVIPESGPVSAFTDNLLQSCRQVLPWYMVPERIIFVDEFPLNPNGKIDRKALAEKYGPEGNNKTGIE